MAWQDRSRRENEGSAARERVALAHGLYWTVTGAWPLVHLPSFVLVTGPKTDYWMVNTIGLLITVNGIVVLMAWWRKRINAHIVLLAIGGELAMAGIDIVYVARDVIWPIYLADAGVELLLVTAWIVAICLDQRPTRQS